MPWSWQKRIKLNVYIKKSGKVFFYKMETYKGPSQCTKVCRNGLTTKVTANEQKNYEVFTEHEPSFIKYPEKAS